MKRILSLFLFLFLISQVGCKHTGTGPEEEFMYVSFEIENSFKDDHVRLALDGMILLDSNITTNYIVSLAWSSGLRKLSRTIHIVNFAVVEYAVQKDFFIDAVSDTSAVLFKFFKDSREIEIRQVEGLTFRD